MTTSINIYTVDATTAVTKQFAVNFTLGFLSRDHVTAFVDGEVDGLGAQLFRTITWINDGLVTLSGTLNVNDVVKIQRTTPAESLIHDFQAGAVLREGNLDEAHLQALMILHEVFDGRNIADFSQNLNMNAFDIDNVGTLSANAVNVGGFVITDETSFVGVTQNAEAVPTAQGTNVQAELDVRSSIPVASVSDLLALDKAAYKYASTAGYTAPNDGGGALYYLDAADTTSADDGFLVIVAIDGGRWKLNHGGRLSLKTGGAVGDDTTDDTAKIQAVFTYAAANGIIVDAGVPSVAYRITAPLVIDRGLRLVGAGIEPFTRVSTEEVSDISLIGRGSWFHIDHTGIGFDIYNSGTDTLRVTGVDIRGIGTIRNQPAPGVGWAPTANDFDFNLGADANSSPANVFLDVHLRNATKGVFMGRRAGAVSGSIGRVTLRVTGQVFDLGVELAYCLDVVTIERAHFWPYWSLHADVTDYQWNNLNVIKTGKADWPRVNQIFSFSHRTVLLISGTGTNGVTNMYVGDLGSDFCQHTCLVEGDGNSVTIESLMHNGRLPDAKEAILITGDSNRIKVRAMLASNSDQFMVRSIGASNFLFMGQTEINNWSVAASDDEAIHSGVGERIEISGPMRFLGSATKHYGGTGIIIRHGDVELRGNSVGTVAAGATVYVGDIGQQVTEADARQLATRRGIIRKLVIATGGGPGGAETYTYTLMLNGIATSMTGTLTGTTSTLVLTAPTVDVPFDTSELSLRLVTSGAAVATRHRFYALLDPSS